MDIAHISSECAPFAKVGGLADVLVGLCKELARKNHTVDLFIPHYPFAEHHLPPLCPIEEKVRFFFGKEEIEVVVSKTIYEGIHIYLVALNSASKFFERNRIYGYPDDAERFLAFSKACLEIFHLLKKSYAVVHVHDWPTAIVPILFDEVPRPQMKRPKFVFTIHNLSYQGHIGYEPLQSTGVFSPSACKMLEDLYIPFRFNLLLGGIRAADEITTVSPTYAKEIMTPELGRGLHEIFHQRQHHFQGILNGLDPLEFERYLEIPKEVKERQLIPVLQLKKKIRTQLIEELKMDPTLRPWVIAVTRLVEQKAPELIYTAAKTTLEKGGSFLLVGSDPEPPMRALFEGLVQEWGHTNRLKIVLEYNPKLAERAFAAADFCVIPSHFEPCGLTQFYSFYFATVPVVHTTGGLADTVFDDGQATPQNPVNGYSFSLIQGTSIQQAMNRALDEFQKSPYLKRQENGVKVEISWKPATKSYYDLYKK